MHLTLIAIDKIKGEAQNFGNRSLFPSYPEFLDVWRRILMKIFQALYFSDFACAKLSIANVLFAVNFPCFLLHSAPDTTVIMPDY